MRYENYGNLTEGIKIRGKKAFLLELFSSPIRLRMHVLRVVTDQAQLLLLLE